MAIRFLESVTLTRHVPSFTPIISMLSGVVVCVRAVAPNAHT